MVAMNRLRHRLVRWLLIDGNRLAVAGLTVGVMFGLLLAINPFPSVTSPNATTLFYLFSSLLGGNLNLLTVVVAINQLVYSRELNSTGKLRSEIQDIDELRQSVAEAADRAVAPIAPAEFVRVLTDEIANDLDRLASTVDLNAPAGTSTSVDARLQLLLGMLRDQLDAVTEYLDQSHAKTVDVLEATLAIDVSEANYLVSSVQNQETRQLPGRARETLDSLGTRLEQLVLVRNHFESIYTQENLAKMSRQLLFVGVPVEFLMGIMLLWFVGVPVEFLMGIMLLWFVGLLGPIAPAALPSFVVYLLMALGLAPLAVVFAFVIRAVTIARQTAIMNQFISQRNAGQWRETYAEIDDDQQ